MWLTARFRRKMSQVLRQHLRDEARPRKDGRGQADASETRGKTAAGSVGRQGEAVEAGVG